MSIESRTPLWLLLTATLTCLGAPLAFAQQDPGDEAELRRLEEQAIKQAVEQASPAVVRIETFGGLEQVDGVLVGAGPTTGVVVSEEGHILSSAINFAQMPSSILVTLADGQRTTAKIVARDHSKMLVLLKANTDQPLEVPQVVPRDELVVGQWTIALGRTFSPDQPNISVGVLSAVNRIWGKAVQTDAKISPSNYGGPLIDITGRVIGVLVPLSPQQEGEMAGAEWYDSGIGFAVPLAEIVPRLEKLKAGEDLAPGILGVALKGKDLYADPVILAAVRPNSPAAEAELQKDDQVVEANGQPIVRQAQLKHVLGPLYAGDQVELKVKRGETIVDATVTLTDELIAYQHPFLGILPRRPLASETADAANAGEGAEVRYVYDDSPAARAGVQAGDRIVKLGEEAIQSSEALRLALANLQSGASTTLAWQRGDERLQAELELASLPTEVPDDELPPASQAPLAEADERPPVGIIEISLPEFANDCFAYVPEDYHPDVPHGLAVLLHPPGGFSQEAFREHWKELCDKYDLILLAPQAEDAQRWNPTEVDFVRKTITEITGSYQLDPHRMAVLGEQAGGAMAFLVALRYADTIRAVATVDAALPRLARVPDNEPLQRLAFLVVYSEQSRLADAINQGVTRLREANYPVTVRQQARTARSFSPQQRAWIGKWIDTLDRL